MNVLLLLLFWPLASASAFNWNIVPFTSQSNCLTMAGNSNSNDATFSLSPCSSTNTYQQFTFGTTSTYLITFQSSNTGGGGAGCSHMCLDVMGANYNQAPVTQTDCDVGKKSQYWVQVTAPLAASGYYWYQNFATGRCLTGESALPGGTVDQYDCSAGALHQNWDIATDSFLWGQPIKNQLWGNCLQITDANPNSGAPASADSCSATAYHQHFNPLTQTPNTWKLVGSGKCLDGGGGGQGAYQWDCSPGAYNQQWLATCYPNDGCLGYWYMVDLLSGLCLTWAEDDLNNVHLETCVQGNTNQQWMQRIA